MDEITQNFLVITVLGAMGTFLIAYSFWLLAGKRKDYYFTNNIYAGRVYTGIPGGLMFICWAIGGLGGIVFQSLTIAQAFMWIGLGFGGLALLFNIIQPSFLKPKWLREVEREHGDIIWTLKEEANRMGLKNWEKRVETQAALESWIADVRRRRNL